MLQVTITMTQLLPICQCYHPSATHHNTAAHPMPPPIQCCCPSATLHNANNPSCPYHNCHPSVNTTAHLPPPSQCQCMPILLPPICHPSTTHCDTQCCCPSNTLCHPSQCQHMPVLLPIQHYCPSAALHDTNTCPYCCCPSTTHCDTAAHPMQCQHMPVLLPICCPSTAHPNNAMLQTLPPITLPMHASTAATLCTTNTCLHCHCIHISTLFNYF